MQKLVTMLFRSNQQSSAIPPELGTLGDLMVLDLGDNELSGKIPERIGENLMFLLVLRLHHNKFVGRIPQSLCKMLELQVVDVAYNLLTGIIPYCLGDLNAMVNSSMVEPSGLFPSDDEILLQFKKGVALAYATTLGLVYNMDLLSNKLVGEIPVELTSLCMLMGLNFSNNHLSGVIPDSVGNMTKLESLDFLRNDLTGVIPPSMAALTFLSHLNLSNNNLSGSIPTGNQLKTLDDPSIYAGNKNLCGPPLPNNCSNHEADDGKTKEWLFYVDIMSGFATGFCGAIGVLWLKKQGRQKLFMFAEEKMAKICVALTIRITKMNRGREAI